MRGGGGWMNKGGGWKGGWMSECGWVEGWMRGEVDG